MRDYWLTKDLLQATGIAFIVLSLIGIALALWLPKKWWGKLLAVIAVAFVISLPLREARKEEQQQQVVVDDYKERYTKAKALFDERCKSAGEKIYKTVDGVEGVLLEKIRPKKINFSDQFVMDDPYGRDLGEEGYVSSFLRVPLEPMGAESQGYLFVDVKDKTGKSTRYQLQRKNSPAGVPYTVLNEIQNTDKVANFSIDYTDISTPMDRENWIAGGKLLVTDLNTKQLIAERTGFIFDRGLGNVDGGRGPWEAAISCGKDDRQYGHTARFLMKSIKPVTGK